jgi:hypothetical protein
MACRGYDEATRALSGYIVAGRAGQGTATLDHVGTVCSTLGIDLGRLSAIHVAGTKGKGSTSALAERLLREAGLRTGLFTSPHLVDVRERVRINGRVLDKDTFARYFWTVHDAVAAAVQEHAVHLHYFHFLTVLGFYVFQEERVDVAVMEVGLGGRLDSTNVLPRPGPPCWRRPSALPPCARRPAPSLRSRVCSVLQSSAASPCWISTTWPFSATPSRSLPARRRASSKRTCPLSR